jgi:protein tyrosine/serine phosphatase
MIRPIEVDEGKVYRGERPEHWYDLTRLKTKGIKTILSLEYGFRAWFDGNLNEEVEWASGTDIDVLSIRMNGLLPPSHLELNAALVMLTNPAKYPIYVHCYHGVDRTGFVIAAYRVRVQGWSFQAAYNEMINSGFHRWCYWWWVHSLKEYLGAG